MTSTYYIEHSIDVIRPLYDIPIVLTMIAKMLYVTA